MGSFLTNSTHHYVLWPEIAFTILLMGTVFQLHRQGRRWWCACGRPFLWVGDIWSPHTSQHLFDHYSFTHVLHGVMFYGLVSLVIPQMQFVWRLWIVTGIEALWEIFENTQFIINRYRSVTIGLGYDGDSIVNSLSDIGCCVIGFILVQYLGFWWSLTLFVVIEFVLLFWIRDNLTLNILMLVWPVEAIRSWQMLHNRG